MTPTHQAAIKRFWELIEPDPEAYSRWLNRCLELLPEQTVRNFGESMVDPSACRRCGSPLKDDRCTDETCPFSDCLQSDVKGWMGHPAWPHCSECGNPFDDNPGKDMCQTCEDWA